MKDASCGSAYDSASSRAHAPSRWSGTEVNQHGLVLCFGLAERSVYLFVPQYCHLCSPEIELPQSMYWMCSKSSKSLFCFFLQASGDRRNHLAWTEPHGHGNRLVKQAGNHNSFSRHHPLVACPRHV